MAGCSPDSPVVVRPPDGPARGCARLADALPDTLDGRDRRDTSPSSERTAAWGDPPVRLRCGAAPPAGLTPESEVVEVDGVEWFLDEPSPPYRLATVGRATVVEVLVPPDTARAEVTAPLVDLAPAIKKAIPPG